VENIAKLKAEVEHRLTELRCRRDEAAHKLVVDLIQTGRFGESALDGIAKTASTIDALRQLGPVFDAQVVRVKTDAIDRELIEARERLEVIASECAEAKRVEREALRAEPTLRDGKLDFHDVAISNARVNVCHWGKKFADVEREIRDLERRRANIAAGGNEPAVDEDSGPDDDAALELA
jgi:hypothetical protein